VAATVRLCGGLAIVAHVLHTLRDRVNPQKGTQ
jgi:hypothetical protein